MLLFGKDATKLSEVLISKKNFLFKSELEINFESAKINLLDFGFVNSDTQFEIVGWWCVIGAAQNSFRKGKIKILWGAALFRLIEVRDKAVP